MNVIVKNVLNSVPMSVDGHRCEEQEADVASSYGSTAAFSVWRAADLQGFAMRIASVTNSATLTVSFSKVRIEQPPEDIFLPPNGFTKYDSAEAMMDELASRQLNLRRSGPSPFSGMEHGEGAVGSQGGRRY